MDFEYEEKHLVNKLVTYSLELDGQWILVENVPARVNEETGEQFFSPETVERLQDMILGENKPLRFVETPVYQFNEVA
jgi:hypothetical protein